MNNEGKQILYPESQNCDYQAEESEGKRQGKTSVRVWGYLEIDEFSNYIFVP